MWICAQYFGCRSFFITFTANPKWPEITEATRETSPTATSSDRADIKARVFKLKLDELMHDLMHKQVMGRLNGISMVVEDQKRMLPRAYIVVIIHPDNRYRKAEDIDKLVSAEIPRENTDTHSEETREYFIQARTDVVTHMSHGPSGAENPSECFAKYVEGASRDAHSFQHLLKLIWGIVLWHHLVYLNNNDVHLT
jgi:hypothetical protein